MKIRIEMNNIERKFAENMMSKWAPNPSACKLKSEKNIEKYGQAEFILNENGSVNAEFEFKTEFMLDVMDMVGDAADVFKGIFSLNFFKNFKSKLKKWDMTETESLAKYIFSSREHEETELLMIWKISNDVFQDSFIMRESDPLSLIQKVRADGYELSFWEDHDGLPKEVNPMDAIGVLIDLQKKQN